MLSFFLVLAAGLAMLLGGGNLLVRGASGIARALKISSLVIGLTIVAVGTSVPELATSMKSTRVQGTIVLWGYCTYMVFRVLFAG